MKRYISYSVILAVVLTSALVFFNRCSMGDTTRVTIRLNPNSLSTRIQHRSIIDTVLESLSTPLYAWFGWNPAVDTLTLTVEGQGMDTITASIPPASESYTIEVPSGSNRTFTIIARAPEGDVSKNWGGHVTTNLFAGEETGIQISMHPMTAVEFFTPTSQAFDISYYTTSYATGYKLYRSYNPEGPYSNIRTNPSTPPNQFTDSPVEVGVTYYYRISVVTASGEGELCDYVSGVGNP